jgi:SAM-dependent methyltransferase
MWTHVLDLRDFYASSLGQVACRMIRRRIREIWPGVAGLNVLGVGYPTPYLVPFRDESQRVIAVMPQRQGVTPWPRDGGGLVALADETELPLPDLSMDRVLLVHALECSERVRPMMREIWRVLNDGGRLLAVVPNRRGIWAQLDRTPFGHGHPYTISQLSRLLEDTMFTPLQSATALFVPPAKSRMLLASALAWERVGERWLQTFAGVNLVEASKQVHAVSLPMERAKRRRVYAVAPQVARRERRVAGPPPISRAEAGRPQAR